MSLHEGGGEIRQLDVAETIDLSQELARRFAEKIVKHVRLLIVNSSFFVLEGRQLRECVFEWLRTLPGGKEFAALCSNCYHPIKESDDMSANRLQDTDLVLKQLGDFFFPEVVFVPVDWILEVAHIVVGVTLGETGSHVLMETLCAVICHMYCITKPLFSKKCHFFQKNRHYFQ